MKRRLLLVVLLLLLTAPAAGCGGGNDAGPDAAGPGRGTGSCEGPATSDDLGLPSDFPQVEAVTFVVSEQKGPTRSVDGYADGDIEELYDEFRSGFEDAGYEILFDEQEENDAEISYRASDDTEGLVALRSCDGDKTSVHITNRPG